MGSLILHDLGIAFANDNIRMLLILSDSVAGLDFSADGAHCDAIENILSSAFEGKNFALASREVIQAVLAQEQYFSRKSVSFLKHLRSSFSEKFGIKQLVDTQILIDPLQTLIDQKEKIFTVPLHIFEDRTVADAVVLLCENLIDCRLYEHAARHYLHSRRMKGVTLSIEKQPGGGSTTPHIVQQITQERRHFCLCIVDSDRHSPESALGNTAKGCLAVATNQWVLTVMVTSEREGENMIPSGLLLASQTGIALDRAVDLEERFFAPRSTMQHYLDYKKGATLEWVFAKAKAQTSQRAFWLSEIEANAKVKASLNNDCLREQQCGNPHECDCLVFSGVCNGLLESVVDWLDVATTPKSYEVVCNCDHESWLSTGKEVFEWCCAHERIRA